MQPLNKNLYKDCISLGVEGFTVHLEDGHDEVTVYLALGNTPRTDAHNQLENSLEEWVWDEFEYNWSDDGTATFGFPYLSYGDHYVYNLLDKKVVHSEWWTSRKEGPETEEELELIDEDALSADRTKEVWPFCLNWNAFLRTAGYIKIAQKE